MQRHFRQMLIQLLKLFDEHRDQVNGNDGKRGQKYGINEEHRHTPRHFPPGEHTHYGIQHIRNNHSCQERRKDGFEKDKNSHQHRTEEPYEI
ncbi:hypothetical protein D3C74_377950 [compost metagenome]